MLAPTLFTYASIQELTYDSSECCAGQCTGDPMSLSSSAKISVAQGRRPRFRSDLVVDGHAFERFRTSQRARPERAQRSGVLLHPERGAGELSSGCQAVRHVGRHDPKRVGRSRRLGTTPAAAHQCRPGAHRPRIPRVHRFSDAGSRSTARAARARRKESGWGRCTGAWARCCCHWAMRSEPSSTWSAPWRCSRRTWPPTWP